MNGRLAARAADAEALLARFNGASEAALAALDRGDRDALVQALDVRDALQQEIERVVREENLGGKGKLKMKMVLTAEGTGLKHVVEGDIDLG